MLTTLDVYCGMWDEVDGRNGGINDATVQEVRHLLSHNLAEVIPAKPE